MKSKKVLQKKVLTVDKKHKQIMKAISALNHKLDKMKKTIENPKPIFTTIRHSGIMEEPVRLRNFYQLDEKKDSSLQEVN